MQIKAAILMVTLVLVTLSSPVLAQGEVLISDMVRIFGDVNVPAGTRVTGNAVAIGGSARVHGEVQGDVVAVLGGVTLGPAAVVHGQVVVIGGELQRASGAIVRGGVTSVSVGNISLPTNWRLSGSRFAPDWLTAFRLSSALGMYLLALLFLLLLPEPVQRVASTIGRNAVPGLLWGLLILILAVPTILILAITIIGIPAAIGLGLGLALMHLLGHAGLSLFLGSRVASALGSRESLPPAGSLLVGAISIAVLSSIPLLGWVMSLGFSLLSIGAATMATLNRSPRPE